MTSEAPELLPCPFCGGKAEMRQYGNEHTRTRGYDTACTNKNCRFGREDRVFRYTLEWLHPRVVAAWNTRADLSPQWRPISEAPRDGTKIVIARAGWSCFPVAQWMKYPGNPVLDDNGDDVWMSGWGHDSAGFNYGHEDYWLGWSDDPMPTHFMPLPEAPK